VNKATTELISENVATTIHPIMDVLDGLASVLVHYGDFSRDALSGMLYLAAYIGHNMPREDTGQCEVAGCDEPAEYEGWYKVTDPMGVPTGLIQLRRVCGDHKGALRGQA